MPSLKSLLLVLGLLLSCVQAHAADPVLQVGSKRFTESYVLGEIITRTAATAGTVRHQQGLGNTAIVFNALKAGSIDLYPEYLGTINSEILKHDTPSTLEQLRAELAPLGLGIGVPLGFDNTYALAMRGTPDGGPATLAELAALPQLRLGLSHEFLGRVDGWPGLAQQYRLPQRPTGLDHGIAYEALMAKQVDVIDIYSTDAKIGKLGLRVLKDNNHFFPGYEAVLLYRLDLPQRFPAAWAAIGTLEGRIDNTRMIAMNAAVEIDGQSFAAVATQFVTPATTAPAVRNGFMNKLFGEDFWRLTRQHVVLVAVAILGASLIGIPLGVLAAFVRPLRQAVMALVGVLQTIPALALLAMLIPLLGRIGTTPALIALFLYALLPIVRNTCTGVLQVPAGLRMAALALGLSRRDRLLHIDLPLALPVILAGLKTAAVMSVGTATIAAFIGAGGYGERIAIGLALNDNVMLLAGAIPAAALALLTQAVFDLLERVLVRDSGRVIDLSL
ncbi:glycine betaine ABC transporter substrate-binding protein [Actimicrobium sp. CCC2.4]|uniref:glycine betaine ABC transporter substrate-binding protein n=1 Tax=Actimicrobium sp. CCC2.4 TaxID=3048606 RepID=UPI002AC9DCA0|nr:glycine betaine ABC transporter substrate-binding protein [Actimicrobium sp. CCC2.4]MEB0133742.1 glycine betaine ABC transporter substrate-binding protein [Actimicrobium sp. CCC2.4]WPX31288.1 glycine betaine ABC transporter substrate-binding protein [Actimicrobium sp. CCC2.4]